MNILLVFIFIIINCIFFYLYTKRTKRMLSKVNAETEERLRYHTKLLKDTLILFIGRIEKRLATPYKAFGNSTGKIVWLTVFTYNRKDLLLQTISSIRRFEPDINILVIDNGSTDGTPQELIRLQQDNMINKILLNKNTEVPQWQKSFNIRQSFELLSVETVDYLAWCDDDLILKKPFVDNSVFILNELKSKSVKLINLLVDEVNNINHPVIETVTVLGEPVYIKPTLAGMFVFFHYSLLETIGLPPINEGINDMSVEDWYYSRLMQANDFFVAAIDYADHLGYYKSTREKIQFGSNTSN